MGGRDCCFLAGYVAAFFSFICFLVSFTRQDWMTYKYGMTGLWVDCFRNKTETKDFDCSNNAKAEGPVYLELTRTFEILALVCSFIGVFGHNFVEPPTFPTTCGDQVKARMQELGYFLAGVLTLFGIVMYGMNYHKYYTEDKDRVDVELGFGFYFGAVSAGLFIVFSILLACTKDTNLKETYKRKERAHKLNNLKPEIKIDSSKRNNWLKNKKVPTLAPSAQKEKEEEKDVNDLAVVKESGLKRVIKTSNVVLAFNRLKSGKGRREEREAIDKAEREIEYLKWRDASKLQDAEQKYKGIFTVEHETGNTPTLSPMSTGRRVASSTGTPTPRSVRIVADDTTSTSSSSSFTSSSSSSSSDLTSSEDLMVTAKDGAILPSANVTAAALEDSLPPRNTDHPPQPPAITDTTPIPPPQRHTGVRRSVTTLRDNAQSKKWAVDHSAIVDLKPKTHKVRRHHSHDGAKAEQKRAKSKSKAKQPKEASGIPAKNMYILPADGAHPAHLQPPRYEEVIGSHDHHHAPQPIMTTQSRVYQPYSQQ